MILLLIAIKYNNGEKLYDHTHNKIDFELGDSIHYLDYHIHYLGSYFIIDVIIFKIFVFFSCYFANKKR